MKKIYIVIIIIGKTNKKRIKNKKKNKKLRKLIKLRGKQKRGSEQALVSYGKEYKQIEYFIYLIESNIIVQVNNTF